MNYRSSLATRFLTLVVLGIGLVLAALFIDVSFAENGGVSIQWLHYHYNTSGSSSNDTTTSTSTRTTRTSLREKIFDFEKLGILVQLKSASSSNSSSTSNSSHSSPASDLKLESTNSTSTSTSASTSTSTSAATATATAKNNAEIHQDAAETKALTTTTTTTTTTATTTTQQVDNNNHNKLTPLTPEEAAKAEQTYYQYRYEQMQKIPYTALINWDGERYDAGGRRKKYVFNNVFRFAFGPHLIDISNLKATPLETVKNVQKYKFFRHDGSLCQAAKIFYQYRTNTNNKPLPHVLLSTMTFDYGAFSDNSAIPGKQLKGFGQNLFPLWQKHNCTKEFIFEQYLDHPDTLAVFTNQFQIYNHPKVISLPLGLKGGNPTSLFYKTMLQYSNNTNRTQFLMHNLMGSKRPMRGGAFRAVANYWGPTSKYPTINSRGNYGVGHKQVFCPLHVDPKNCYNWELTNSKFIVAPSGMGIDCYRNWEALYMGAIPVIARPNKTSDGWATNTLADLPLVVVENYNLMTPEFLEQEYERLVLRKDPREYKFEKLNRYYWIDMAWSFVGGRDGNNNKNATNKS